jgi:hypothetical protein
MKSARNCPGWLRKRTLPKPGKAYGFSLPRYLPYSRHGDDRQWDSGTSRNDGSELENKYASELLSPGTKESA